jgi:beta-galactosidase
MKPIAFDACCYRIDGAPAGLYSGEFHYFRVPRSDWRRRMELFREAGGNCLATYVPWLIHEPEEGNFVFGGESGTHDLEGFLRMAAEVGLYVIARPGPYQYSELKCDGLPGWLCENYPALHARDIDGKAFRTSSVSYVHPLFLEKVARWFAVVGPRLARHTVSRGGPVAFVQVDNELTGIHVWHGSMDYHPESMGFGRRDGRYPRFLRERYRTVGALNRAYGTKFASFERGCPRVPVKASHRVATRIRRDYLDFYLGTVAEYARTLADMLRAQGVDVPFVHNSASPAMNSMFLETVRAFRGDFLLGSDHYYNLNQEWAQNNPTPQYAANVFGSLEMLRLMGFPPTVFELPSGSLSDWPPITPEDARACYWTNVALGAKGINYYIYTGGPNPPGCGTTSDIYDYGAAVGADGEVRPLYQVQKELGRFLKARPWLAETGRECDCRLGLDFESARAEKYWKGRGEELFAPPEAWTFLRKGPLSSAFCASLSPAFCNLDADDWTVDTSTPVVVAASCSMSRARQERIVRFLEAGGRVLFAPVLPGLDESLRRCTVLADFLGRPIARPAGKTFVRISVVGVENVYNNGEVFLWERLPRGAVVVGTDEVSGRPVAWEIRTRGGGHAVVLGFRWVQAMREHERMLRTLLERLGLRQRVLCDNPNVWTSLRTAGSRSAIFLMNLLSAPQEATVSCRPGWSRAAVDTGRHRLGPMSVKVIELG